MKFGTTIWVMDIPSGLAGLKAAADLTKVLRDAAKSGSLKPDEFAGRVGEIYDYIIDSKAALVDAQEVIVSLKGEILSIKAKIQAFDNEKEFRGSLKFNQEGYWSRIGQDGDELYCSACLDDGKRVRLTRRSGTDIFQCHNHGIRKSLPDDNPYPANIQRRPRGR
jgi:hypothetical protein